MKNQNQQTSAHKAPSGGYKDVAGRTYHDSYFGFGDEELPVGSKVLLHPGTRSPNMFNKYFAGREAVVITVPRQGRDPRFDPPTLLVRLIEPCSAWEVNENMKKFHAHELEVLVMGDGQVVPGISYRLCEKEIWDARFKAFDFRHEGYTNLPTFLAAVYLKQDHRHVEAVRQMLRANQTINPLRLANYFRKAPTLKVDESAFFQGDFPARYEYRVHINWDEIAAEFNQSFEEERQYA